MRPLDFNRVPALVKGRWLRLFIDFDGTLSPHRPDGNNSEPLPAAREALAALAGLPNVRICIVSGRTIADLRRRIGVRGISYAGNHGLMIKSPDGVFEHPLSAVARRAVSVAASLLRSRLGPDRGARIRRNGVSLSLSVGMAKADGRRAAASLVESSTHELERMRLRWQEGYLGWDLIPDVGWDKGDAVWHLLGLETDVLPMAVGDSLSDEPMFEQVAGKGGLSIRVGFSSSSKARHWVRGPRDVARLLRIIARSQAKTAA